MGTPSFFHSILPDLVLTYLKLQMENSFGIAFWKLADESCGLIILQPDLKTTDFDVQVTGWPVSHFGCCL
jgi:hypothetical protein